MSGQPFAFQPVRRGGDAREPGGPVAPFPDPRRGAVAPDDDPDPTHAIDDRELLELLHTADEAATRATTAMRLRYLDRFGASPELRATAVSYERGSQVLSLCTARTVNAIHADRHAHGLGPVPGTPAVLLGDGRGARTV